MDKKLRNGIFTVFLANVINLFFSLATNFLLPKYLSVETYAGIKTFQLYVSYVGLLHFGYIDGMYLKYGGINFKKRIDKGFALNISTMRIFELTVTVIITIIALLARDRVMLLFAISVFPQNLSSYYQFLYQATGEFSLYGRVMNLSTIGTFVVNMFLLFLLHCDTDIWYISFYVVLYYLIWIILEVNFRKTHSLVRCKLFSWSELKRNIQDGFLLTLGNLASMIQNGMDSWFVKFLMDVTSFAQYSFAVSVGNFMNLAVTPITITLYNYFCREKNIEKQRELTRGIFIFATVLPSAAFLVKFILEVYLQHYITSVYVIFWLFASQMFSIIIRSVFINLYKVKRKQNIYFLKLIFVLTLGFGFNIVCYQVLHVKEAFAIGTLLSSLIWYIISTSDFKYLKITVKDNIYLLLSMTGFLFTGFFLESIIGMFTYLAINFILLLLFMRPTLVNLIRFVKRAVCKVVKNSKLSC